jgi:indole-3-glycerol phosphate synthase
MADILAKIEAYKREEIAAAKRARPLAAIEAEATVAAAPRGFIRAIERQLGAGSYALIAEIKKASPSKGLIRADFDPPALARAYEKGGAACLGAHRCALVPGPAGISVRGACGDQPPGAAQGFHVRNLPSGGGAGLGRRLHSHHHGGGRRRRGKRPGGDSACLRHGRADRGPRRARARPRALLTSRLIGVNNRNLKTFETALATSRRLAPRIPAGRIAVGESGIFAPADLDELAAVGISTFLVGESLMREHDVEAATRALIAGKAGRDAHHLGAAE